MGFVLLKHELRLQRRPGLAVLLAIIVGEYAMPRFDPFQDISTAALVASIAALEARVALLESVVVIDSSGAGVTLTARGKLKLTSVFPIDMQAPVLDASFVTVKCDRLLANAVTRGGQSV